MNEYYDFVDATGCNVLTIPFGTAPCNLNVREYNETLIILGRELNPKEDMTPIESVRLCQLMIMLNAGSSVDETFINKYNLQRHFK
jgi:hypothetical protein